MSEYFLLHWDTPPLTAFAYTQEETPLAHHLIEKLKGLNVLPFPLVLKKVLPGHEDETTDDLSGLQHIWMDYQPNNLAWPLMSRQLMEIISKNLSGKEGVEWITADIQGPDGPKRYYIPRFTRQLNVLDRRKTSFVKGTDFVISPCFSRKKISGLSLFYRPQDFWQISPGLYVNNEIKEAILAAGLTGIGFEPADVY